MNHVVLIISYVDVLVVKGIQGVTQFYLSLEDELMRRFGSDQMKSMMTKLGMDDTTANSIENGITFG